MYNMLDVYVISSVKKGFRQRVEQVEHLHKSSTGREFC